MPREEKYFLLTVEQEICHNKAHMTWIVHREHTTIVNQVCSLDVMLLATLGASSTPLEFNNWEGSQPGIISVLTTVAAVCLYISLFTWR